MGEALPDFTIKGDIQSDLQSLAYIPQKLPERPKIGIKTTSLDSAGFRLQHYLSFGRGVALIATVC